VAAGVLLSKQSFAESVSAHQQSTVHRPENAGDRTAAKLARTMLEGPA